MARATWVTRSADIVRQIVADNQGLDDKELRKVITSAYPYRERMGWAYKAWLKAVKQVLGNRKQVENVRNMWVKE